MTSRINHPAPLSGSEGVVSSDAPTPETYLASIEEKRQATMITLARSLSDSLPDWSMVMKYGMLSWVAPNPDDATDPFVIVSLANQLRHISLYLMPIYMDESEFKRIQIGYERIGKKPNMGKSCLRFTQLGAIPLDEVLAMLREYTPEVYAHQRQQALERGSCS